MDQMDRFYTSRSSIEHYQKCPRYRYLHDYYDGTGIVPSSKSVPLTTGTCIHLGIEYLLKRVKLTSGVFDLADIDNACQLALNEYINLAEKAGFHGKGVSLNQQQQYTFSEQKALTEALIRVWAYVELPLLLERFVVVDIERELAAKLPGTDNIYLQARVDAELQDKSDQSYYNYSLKTTKQWDERMEKSYKQDLQGLTEIWVSEQQAEIVNEYLQRISDNTDDIYRILREPKFIDIRTYLLKKEQKKKRIMGVKFCFLVKGYYGPVDRGNPDSIYHTNSPLIRGYRNISPTEISYASSLWYKNPENKSGWGKLGKGWEEFDVWDDPGGFWTVKKWIDYLMENDKEILKERCVTPPEYFRDEKEIEEAILNIAEQESKIMYAERVYRFLEGEEHRNIFLTTHFPKYRGSCHYPLDCEYNMICWEGNNSGVSGEVGRDPVGSGLYQIRVPHHREELEQFEERRKKNATNTKS